MMRRACVMSPSSHPRKDGKDPMRCLGAVFTGQIKRMQLRQHALILKWCLAFLTLDRLRSCKSDFVSL